MANAGGALPVTLNMGHLITRRFVIGIKNQDLGISLLGLGELAGPKISVSLEQKFLHRGDPALEFIRHGGVIGCAFGIADLLFVSHLLSLQVLDVRRIDGIIGLKHDRPLQQGCGLGKFIVLGQFLGLARLGGSQTGFGAVIRRCRNAAIGQGIKGKLKSIGGLVILTAAQQALSIGNGLTGADDELLTINRLRLSSLGSRGRRWRQEQAARIRSTKPECREWQQRGCQ